MCTMHERSDYRSFALNLAGFVLNSARPRPTAQVRNERRWRSCSASMLQPSTLSHVVAQPPKASYHVAVTSMLRSSSIHCWLGGNQQVWEGLGIDSRNNSVVTHAFWRVSHAYLRDHADLSTREVSPLQQCTSQPNYSATQQNVDFTTV